MISEEDMKRVKEEIEFVLRRMWHKRYFTDIEYREVCEVANLIPLGWQVASNREDSRVGVALESDDSD